METDSIGGASEQSQQCWCAEGDGVIHHFSSMARRASFQCGLSAKSEPKWEAQLMIEAYQAPVRRLGATRRMVRPNWLEVRRLAFPMLCIELRRSRTLLARQRRSRL